MSRLTSREKQIPNGFRFKQAETGWEPRPFSSFATVVTGLIAHRKGNATLAAKYSTDPVAVAEEVDRFNTRLCLAMGWTNYVSDDSGGSSYTGPFTQNPQDQKQLLAAAATAKKLWSGVRTIGEWLESKEPAVPKEQAEARAATCVKCPYNGQGDFTRWFTKPAAGAIQRQLERMQQRKLSTSLDDQLGICAEPDGYGGCLCANKLSVHVPLKLKLAHMAADVKASLHPSCWVISEEKQLATS